MQKIELNTCLELHQWLEKYDLEQDRYAFRGQADSDWALETSLGRCFSAHKVDEHEWRKRELKMYRAFRECLLKRCHDMYKEWDPLDILSLMRHHGAPTRILDFSYDPRVAAYFALEDSRGDSAIWVVDQIHLEKRRSDMGLREFVYCGPKHNPYDEFHKDQEGNYRLVGFIRPPERLHARLAAQRGCFFIPGSISKEIDDELVHAKVTLSKALVVESLEHLREEGYCEDALFPDLEEIARQATRRSVIGGAEWP